jgi:sporulation protein YlmC with PRC-barrel domain
MIVLFLLLAFLLLAIAAGSPGGLAQSTTTTPSPNAGAMTTTTPEPALVAKEIEGLDVFSSDGQQIGKVAKVNVIADGKVKDVEVQSGGFLGFFSKTYVVPADKLNKKGGRVELSMTSEQAKQFAR